MLPHTLPRTLLRSSLTILNTAGYRASVLRVLLAGILNMPVTLFVPRSLLTSRLRSLSIMSSLRTVSRKVLPSVAVSLIIFSTGRTSRIILSSLTHGSCAVARSRSRPSVLMSFWNFQHHSLSEVRAQSIIQSMVFSQARVFFSKSASL